MVVDLLEGDDSVAVAVTRTAKGVHREVGEDPPFHCSSSKENSFEPAAVRLRGLDGVKRVLKPLAIGSPWTPGWPLPWFRPIGRRRR